MERITGEDGERRGEMIVDSEGTDRQGLFQATHY